MEKGINDQFLYDLLVLSVRQPWAWLIIHAGKDIENRNWATKVRGRVLIHASQGMTRFEYEDTVIFLNSLKRKGKIDNGVTLPPFAELQRGGIIGSVEIVNCVDQPQSPWFFGEYGFVLREPQPLPFYPCKGMLKFFKV